MLQTGEAYILRTCNADMTSHGGFKWPESGMVEAPDWQPTKDCGNGLHGFLWGEGDGLLASWDDDAKWIVARMTEWIDIGDKVKFPRADVVFVGDRKGATDYIISLGAKGSVIGAHVVAGEGGTATAGEGGIIQIKHLDRSRYRILTGYVGKDGIKPNVAYRVEKGKFVEAR